MNKNVVAVLTLAVGLVVGFFVGRNSIPASVGISEQSVKIQKLEQQIEEAKKFFPPVPSDVRSISGTVTSVQGATIVVEVSGNPFDESPRTRTVTVGSQTRIVRNEQKDPVLFGQELAKFQKAVRAQAGKPSPSSLVAPIPFLETPGKLTDIQPGQQVTVTAGENIRDKESFTASMVSIYLPPGQAK